MSRVVVWLTRHPMAAVFLLLAILGGLAWGIDTAFTPSANRSEAPVMVDSGVARSRLPEPTQTAPRQRVEAVHRALHAMARACKQPVATPDPASVRRPLSTMKEFARDFPNAGFTIDDESASTLALLIVLRSELQDCDPTLVPGVEELVPPEYRDSSAS